MMAVKVIIHIMIMPIIMCFKIDIDLRFDEIVERDSIDDGIYTGTSVNYINFSGTA